ncbi:MAG TPA: SPRY domain-containing protein [Candidatus Paceibacterota bacterium]|nr:SPRY domain-containing protein [Candidatus Paceibacterota bacterium]
MHLPFVPSAVRNANKRGFALFVAIVFMSVMLLFGMALASIGYKQQILASSAVESQYAFYAADAGLECALYADQRQNLFAFPSIPPVVAPAMMCEGLSPYSASYTRSATQWTVTNRMKLNSNTRCADIAVTKPRDSGMTYIYSQAYDVPCATVAAGGTSRFVSRGITTRYSISASQSTYDSWNPADTGAGATISDLGMTVTKNAANTGWGPGNYGTAGNSGLSRALFGKSTGKWYWEVRINSGNNMMIGISLGTAATSFLGNDGSGWGWYIVPSGVYYHNAVSTNFSTAGAAGTVLGFALDMSAGTLTAYKNGVLVGTMATGLRGSTVFPAVDLYDGGASITANFGMTNFTYAPPAGFSSFYQ